jgi:hypothetical protein
MTSQELHSASELLASAAGDTPDPDARESLSNLSEQLGRLGDADRGPDHGRLARIESKLDGVQADASDDVAVTIENALDEIHAYRETVEGV